MTALEARRDWLHLGHALRAARGARSRAEVELRSGVSATQIKRYEAGQVTPDQIPDKLWVLATFYNWTPDSLERVLAGGEPTYAPAPPPRIGAPDADVMDKVVLLVSQSESLTVAERRAFLLWMLAQDWSQ